MYVSSDDVPLAWTLDVLVQAIVRHTQTHFTHAHISFVGSSGRLEPGRRDPHVASLKGLEAYWSDGV